MKNNDDPLSPIYLISYIPYLLYTLSPIYFISYIPYLLYTLSPIYFISSIYPKGFQMRDVINLVSKREDISELLALGKYIDLIIPRGSNELVKEVRLVWYYHLHYLYLLSSPFTFTCIQFFILYTLDTFDSLLPKGAFIVHRNT